MDQPNTRCFAGTMPLIAGVLISVASICSTVRPADAQVVKAIDWDAGADTRSEKPSTLTPIALLVGGLGGAMGEAGGYYMAPTLLSLLPGEFSIDWQYAGAAIGGALITPLAVRAVYRSQHGASPKNFDDAFAVSALLGAAGAAAIVAADFRKDFATGLLIVLPVSEAIVTTAILGSGE